MIALPDRRDRLPPVVAVHGRDDGRIGHAFARQQLLGALEAVFPGNRKGLSRSLTLCLDGFCHGDDLVAKLMRILRVNHAALP